MKLKPGELLKRIPKAPVHLLAFKANDLRCRHFQIRWGRWRFENWHLYHLVITWNARYTWFQWRQLF